MREHGCSPASGRRPDQANLLQEPFGSSFHAADLLRGNMLLVRAEASRFFARVHRDLLEALIENANRACVPAHPDFVREILGRHRVERFLYFDMAIAVHTPRAFFKARKTLPSKWLQCWSITAAKQGADLFLGRAMNARV